MNYLRKPLSLRGFRRYWADPNRITPKSLTFFKSLQEYNSGGFFFQTSLTISLYPFVIEYRELREKLQRTKRT